MDFCVVFCDSGKHAHTCLKPTVQGNCTFKRTKESFEEWEIQSKFYIFDENEQEKSFFHQKTSILKTQIRFI